MAYNRPWGIWWDFDNDHIKIQTNHPAYSHIDYIYKFPIKDFEDSHGFIDDKFDKWFNAFVDDVMSGRKSLHKIMKEINNESFK